MSTFTEGEKTNELPPIREIKTTDEIKIGDVLIYTGNPRGTGMFVPEIGQAWEMKTEDDLISAAIEIIERGRGWRPKATEADSNSSAGNLLEQ